MSSSILVNSITLVGYGLAVYVFTHVFRFKTSPVSIVDAKRSSLYSLVAILVSLAIITALFLSLRTSGRNQDIAANGRAFIPGPSALSGIVIFASLMAGPSLMVIRYRRESLSSLGISSTNLVGSVILGLLLSASSFFILITFNHISFVPIRVAHLWAFLYFSVVGFTEEFMFRGYLQTRLVTWLGKWKGWVLSSVIMALYHIPQRYGIEGLTFTQSMVSSLSLVPLSLFLGYLMIRTENLLAPAIFHTFADWLGTLIA